MLTKICRNRFFTGKELKLYSDNEYYIVIDREKLNNKYYFNEFKNTDRFIEDMKSFDSEKEVVAKMILEDDKKYFIEEYEDLSTFSNSTDFIVMNSINNENKDKFIKSLKTRVTIPEC
jgi:hypothetical protein